MPGALRELLVAFGVSVDDKELKKGGEAVDGLIGKAKEAGKILLEAFAVEKIREFISSQIEAGAQLKVMADRLGTDTDELQALELAAGEAGVSVEAMTNGLRFLNRNMAEAVQGGGDAAEIFHKLKIPLKEADGSTRAAGDVMGDLADALAEMPDASKKTAIAMKLLGRGGAELIPLLNRGGEAFDEARKDVVALGGGMSKEFVEAAHEAEAAQVRLNFSLTGLKTRVAGAALPFFVKIVDWMTRATVRAIELSKQYNVFSDGLRVIGLFAGVKAIGTLRTILKLFGLLKGSVLGSVWALLKFAAPLALIALLVLAVQDFWTMLRGGQSVIGDVLTQLLGFDGANKLIAELGDVWNQVVDALSPMSPMLEDVAKWVTKTFIESLPYIVTFAGMLAVDIVAALDNIITTAREAKDLLDDIFGDHSPAAKAARQKDALGMQDALEARGKVRDEARKKLDAVMAGLAGGGGTAGAVGRADADKGFATEFSYTKDKSGAPHPIAGGGTAPVTINQTIHTSSDDPKKVGQAASQGAATAVQKANYNTMKGTKKP